MNDQREKIFSQLAQNLLCYRDAMKLQTLCRSEEITQYILEGSRPIDIARENQVVDALQTDMIT